MVRLIKNGAIFARGGIGHLVQSWRRVTNFSDPKFFGGSFPRSGSSHVDGVYRVYAAVWLPTLGRIEKIAPSSLSMFVSAPSKRICAICHHGID